MRKLTKETKLSKRNREVNRGCILLDYYKTTKVHCKDCKFFQDNKCLKKRVIRVCKKKELKNKE